MSSTRILRVNELIQRELSNLLRRKYNADAAPITITAVQVTPDVREGKVFVSVTGDEEQSADRLAERDPRRDHHPQRRTAPR